MTEKPHISIVSPVYKAENSIEKLVDEIFKTMLQLNCTFEIILVDDRSPDNSWEVMKQLSSKFPEVRSIRLSKNFGQHPAIIAGLSQAKGNWIVVMDCDLQDQPKEIIKLYNKAQEGYDIVMAKRENRQDGFLKKLMSKLFYSLYNYLTDTKTDSTIANFGIYKSKIITEVLRINDYIKLFPLLVNWVGYNATTVKVEHAERDSGKSSYSITKLISLALNTIISFSNKPLKLCVKFGLVISAISFLVGMHTIYLSVTNQIGVLGYTSLMVSIWFLSGVIITTVGICGIYIGKIFDQTKNRQVFIIDEIL
ncbi:glycosyltransferase family 2 protein [Flavobacterium sp.]|uniref:glycosyltransferase family 2 protein n=1 Tax=Flavobacterium sp. TaxID=239 RepID=UPI00374CB090